MSEIPRAIDILQRGGLVAFPTETVYGLGADATNADAVRRIFEAKGRPSTNPLICHVADATVARRYARHWPDAASKLTDRFWPGPLTLILPKTPDIPPEVTAGLDSVGLRAPNHPLALELLKAFEKPLAGPSANRSSHVSPTTAAHVRDDLGDRVDLILDGGACAVGIESTVLDLTTPKPLIRRPGGILREEIELVIGPVDLAVGSIAIDAPSPSPGQHDKHYAPTIPAYRFTRDQLDVVKEFCRSAPVEPAIIFIGSTPLSMRNVSFRGLVEMPISPPEYGQALYQALREATRFGAACMLIEMPPDEPRWLAVRDRLRRATRPLPV